MKPRRVVVTGIGAFTPVGHGADGLWAGVLANRSAVRCIDRFDPSPFPSRVAAQIDDFVPADHLDVRRARRLDRFSALTVAAARTAVGHARLSPISDRTGVFIGSALGGVAFGEEQHAVYVARGVRGVAPTLALAVFGGAGASNVALDLGITGPAIGNANSCASGAVAIGEAFHAIRGGVIDAALAGGAEAPLAPLTFGAFAMIRVLSQRNDDPATASRPFDTGRDGFVMGEGAAVLVLEERASAMRRSAPILGELLGYGNSNDAYHMTAPRPDGRDAARAVDVALADASLGPESSDVPVSGTKGLYGHALGASGAIEAAITVLALHHSLLPGTCNLVDPDPACDLNILRDPLERQVAVGLSTSFGFGGMNAALIIGRA
jgi:3-oxoacyl-[acyl-carrier-protein] synthase II